MLEYLSRKERHPLLHRGCCCRSEVSAGALAEVFAVSRSLRAEGKATAEAMLLSVITGHWLKAHETETGHLLTWRFSS